MLVDVDMRVILVKLICYKSGLIKGYQGTAVQTSASILHVMFLSHYFFGGLLFGDRIPLWLEILRDLGAILEVLLHKTLENLAVMPKAHRAHMWEASMHMCID